MASVRRAEPRDADRVLRLLDELGRPAVDPDPASQRLVFAKHLAAADAALFVTPNEPGRALPAPVSHESYGFVYRGRAHGLRL